MVTIYYDTRPVGFRLPVVSVGRWSGRLLVRLAKAREDGASAVLRAHRAAQSRRDARAVHAADATQQFDRHRHGALVVFNHRGV